MTELSEIRKAVERAKGLTRTPSPDDPLYAPRVILKTEWNEAWQLTPRLAGYCEELLHEIEVRDRALKTAVEDAWECDLNDPDLREKYCCADRDRNCPNCRIDQARRDMEGGN